MPNKYNRVLNVWCWPLLKLLQLLQESVLKWKHTITNNDNDKTFVVSNPNGEKIIHITAKKTVPDQDANLGPAHRRTRLTFKVKSIPEYLGLPITTMEEIEELIDAMPDPKPYFGTIRMSEDHRECEFTIGVTENEGLHGRLMIDRPVQKQYALTIYQFFRVIMGVCNCKEIPSTISFDEWNKAAGRKRKVPESERGMGGAAVDTESDGLAEMATESDEEKEQPNGAGRELDRVISALLAHVNQPAPAVEPNDVIVLDADDEIAKKVDPDVKIPPKKVEKKEESVDLTTEEDPAPAPVAKKEEIVDLT